MKFKYLYLFLLGVVLGIIGFVFASQLGIFGLGLTIPGAYLAGRYFKAARQEWKESKPGYVPPPKKEYEPHYDYNLKLGPKKVQKPIKKNETLEELLDRLGIEFKIDKFDNSSKTDSSGPR